MQSLCKEAFFYALFKMFQNLLRVLFYLVADP